MTCRQKTTCTLISVNISVYLTSFDCQPQVQQSGCVLSRVSLCHLSVPPCRSSLIKINALHGPRQLIACRQVRYPLPHLPLPPTVVNHRLYQAISLSLSLQRVSSILFRVNLSFFVSLSISYSTCRRRPNRDAIIAAASVSSPGVAGPAVGRCRSSPGRKASRAGQGRRSVLSVVRLQRPAARRRR